MKESKNIFKSQIDDLVYEAKELSKSLDSTSDKIRNLENNLKSLKVNFGFEYEIDREVVLPKTPLDTSRILCRPDIHSHSKKKLWSLAWNTETNAKNYRLLLICKQVEFLYGENSHHSFTDIAEEKLCFEKPFIETTLNLRLKYAPQLSKFIEEYKFYLFERRLFIDTIPIKDTLS